MLQAGYDTAEVERAYEAGEIRLEGAELIEAADASPSSAQDRAAAPASATASAPTSLAQRSKQILDVGFGECRARLVAQQSLGELAFAAL